MCSIIGYKGRFKEYIVSTLLDESRLRGIHSFGYHTKNGTKKFLDYTEFKDSLLSEKPDLFIAHFRYSTSGDFKLLENNQPLVSDGKAMVFNGVISQKTKSEMEYEFQTKLPSDNDGWILYDYFNSRNFELPQGSSFAFIGLDFKSDIKLTAIRNELRPMWKFESENYVILTSTKDILVRSGIKQCISPLKKNKVYGW
tara:strand:- start:1473 stop:2066 length:594 start_codon:yes stop_codon:yes gene_type:complete